MEILTIFQFLRILLAYLCMTLLLPALLLYPRMKKMRFSVRFMIYQIVGNFYMMSLVFILQLMRISNRFTLMIFTLVPFCIGYVRINKKHPLQACRTLFVTAEKLAGGQLGMRLFLRQMRAAAGHAVKKFFAGLFERIRKNFGDIVLFAGVTAALVYVYGINLVLNYGYTFSDIVVHNYWINNLVNNNIFVAGVYPYGFHCVIYYLRTIFGIPTYVLLRIFCFVQTLMIHYVLLAFLKCCCKSKYAAYTGVFVYIIAAIFVPNTYIRYFGSLPQEFGMIFILPSIYFLFAFLEKKKEEKKEGEKREKKDQEKKWYLACFAMSFSMTISVHFYNTMICGLFCLGAAVGYCFRLFRRKVFGKVMLAGLLAVVVAVLPMGIAFATGTPLQGSLGWGLNIITGADEEEEESGALETEMTETEAIALETEAVAGVSDDADAGVVLSTEEEASLEAEASSESELTVSGETGVTEDEASDQASQTGMVQKLLLAAGKLPESVWESVCDFLILGDVPILRLAVFGSMALLVLLSVLFFLLRQADYAARLLSSAVYMLLMSVLFGASGAGLPELMDQTRTSIFYAYSIVMVWSLCVDGVLQLFLGWKKKKWLMNLVSFVLVGAVIFCTGAEGKLRDMGYYEALGSNEAVICLTNILNENEDFTWTICSMNDELRMAEDYGYHYETDTFLREMEYSGSYATITITTQKVYFFIEKIPVDYDLPYEGSGQSVSEEGADNPLPDYSGITMYQGESRWIEMSRMYYWAQAFQSMYPNEMKVYYETDNFICYCVEQDLYSPLNFAIDYGYNMG